MGKCIVCRRECKDFSDEHVIPDAINGYYHLYGKLCTSCNSELGSKIDSLITNHIFIEFVRLQLEIEGKKGNIPNPFKGIHRLSSDPKTRVKLSLNEERKFEIYALPEIPKFTTTQTSNKYSFSLDKKDERQIEEIINKFCQRNKLDIEKLKTEKVTKQDNKVQMTIEIDIKKFKLALLKIAYEFTIDNIPGYFEDESAIIISEILHKLNFDELDKNQLFIGNGIESEIFEPFKDLIELNTNNHILLLINIENFGLIAYVKIFNTFFIGIKMSTKKYEIDGGMVIGINDLEIKQYKTFTLSDFINTSFTPVEYRFSFILKNDEILEFMNNNNSLDFDYYYLNGRIPFFDKNGKIIYEDIDVKLHQKQLKKIDKGNFKNSIITEYILDEELYIKILPINKLFHVASVQIEQNKI